MGFRQVGGPSLSHTHLPHLCPNENKHPIRSTGSGNEVRGARNLSLVCVCGEGYQRAECTISMQNQTKLGELRSWDHRTPWIFWSCETPGGRGNPPPGCVVVGTQPNRECITIVWEGTPGSYPLEEAAMPSIVRSAAVQLHFARLGETDETSVDRCGSRGGSLSISR